MNSRERTFLALKHMPSDRIPVDFWATPAVARNLEAALGRAYAQFLDDFGVDYSSLSRLRELPIDHIKIDMRFVRGIEAGSKDEAIAHHHPARPEPGSAGPGGRRRAYASIPVLRPRAL